METKGERILVILPHPDDEVFGLSGTLSKYIASGSQVTYACLTLGEMGRNMGQPTFANRITLPQIRKGELEASARIIGIQDLRMLGFHDKTIEFEVPEVLDASINGLLEEIKPDAIFTFYPGHSVHPDHDATGAAVVRCVARLPKEQRPPVYTMAFSRNCEEVLGMPDVHNDVTDYVNKKLGSLQAHKSQFQMADILGGKEPTETEMRNRFGKERFWTYRFED